MLLDADVIIDIWRSHPPALSWMASLEGLPIVAGVAGMELLFGCRNQIELRQAQKFLDSFVVLWPEHTDMVRAYRDYPVLKLTHNLGISDALIASTAIGHD